MYNIIKFIYLHHHHICTDHHHHHHLWQVTVLHEAVTWEPAEHTSVPTRRVSRIYYICGSSSSSWVELMILVCIVQWQSLRYCWLINWLIDWLIDFANFIFIWEKFTVDRSSITPRVNMLKIKIIIIIRNIHTYIVTKKQ